MGDRFRSMIESELAEVEPPPIGDLVDNAIRDGRHLRRTRLVQRGVACAAAVGVLVLGLGMAGATAWPDEPASPEYGVAAPQTDTGRATDATGANGAGGATGSGPAMQTPAMPAGTPTMAIYQSDPDYAGFATRPPGTPPAAVLIALSAVLPSGRITGQAGARFDSYTGVQIFLNRGAGYGMVRVAVARYQEKPAPECDGTPGVVVECSAEDGALVETFEIDSNCVQRRGVNVYRTDGIAVQINVGSCLVDGKWAVPSNEPVDDQVLGVDEAIKIGLDPIWNEKTMVDGAAKAAQRYPDLPILTAFDGVGA